MFYYTNSWGPDEEAFKAALQRGVMLAKSADKNLVIHVHNHNMLDGGMFETVFGKVAVKALIKTKKITINKEVVMLLETDRQQATYDKAVFFAPYCNMPALNKLLSDSRVIDLVYVPWAEQERDEYILAHPDSQEIPYRV